MKPAVRWIANDGSEFTTADAAEAHDKLIVDCENAMGAIQPRDPRLNCNGGKGYVQHDVVAFTEAKRRLLVILAARNPSDGLDKLDPAIVHPMGYVGRLASEYSAPIAKAWGRLCCIDEMGREWEQPYFALHPEKGEEVELSARRARDGGEG